MLLIKKFPLLYIAVLYLFSTKDKIIFYMQQFTIVSISLIIATIFCCFSIINGFYDQFSTPAISYYGNIFVMSSDAVDKDTQKPIDDNQFINLFNGGFNQFKIEHPNIIKAEFIRMQKTLISMGDSNLFVDVIEVPGQTTDIMLSPQLLKENPNAKEITVFDPNSMSIVGQFSRFKTYNGFSMAHNIPHKMLTVYVSPSEYKKLFHNEQYTAIKIYTKDMHIDNGLLQQLQDAYSKHGVSFFSWEQLNQRHSDLIRVLDLQKKIFYMIYALLFILLGIIIILTNIIFFKEKRKDWALYKMLDSVPYSVERIFMYRNLISYSVSLLVGLMIGALLSIFCNEVIHMISLFSGMSFQKNLFFGLEKLTYVFLYKDITVIALASFVLFFINFVALIIIFKKEKGASFLKSA